MDNRNNYKKLRFDNDVIMKPNITQRELADKLGIGFSTICKLENMGCNNACVSTIKAYKEYFLKEKNEDISYEYLMEETETKNREYYELGKLFPFDDIFYDNLSKLLKMDDNSHIIELMLSAILHNPEELFNALTTIFNVLYKINNIQEDSSSSAYVKKVLIKREEYILNQSIIDYLEDFLMPLLQRGFKYKNEQLANERISTEQLIKEVDFEEDYTVVSDKIISVNPLENK